MYARGNKAKKRTNKTSLFESDFQDSRDSIVNAERINFQGTPRITTGFGIIVTLRYMQRAAKGIACQPTISLRTIALYGRHFPPCFVGHNSI